MTVAQQVERQVEDVGADRGWGALCFLLLAALSFSVFLVVPYYVNDLDQMSSGWHDRKGMWPFAGGGPVAVFFAFGATWAVLLGPATIVMTGLCALVMAVTSWPRLDTAGRAVRLATVALALAASAWTFSPFVEAMTTWYFD